MLGPSSSLPEATAVTKTQHTCCGWVHAAGGSWGTWKWKTQRFLNCRKGIKKLYSAESFPSPSLSVAHPHQWPCLSPEKMTAGFLHAETVPYLSNAEILRQKWVLYCHTQLVLGCGSYIRTIPHTHTVGYAGGWVLVIQSLPEDGTITLLSCRGHAGHTPLEWSERTLGMHLSPTHELLPWALLVEVGWAAALGWVKILLSTSWV